MKKQTPPCSNCLYGTPPELIPANREAFELWLEIHTQWRAGSIGIIGLDYTAVYAEAERLEIILTNCTMGKIKALERYTLEKFNTRNAKDNYQGQPGTIKKIR